MLSAPLVLLAILAAVSMPLPPSFAMPVTLFTFDQPNEPAWQVVNDGVMGGR